MLLQIPPVPPGAVAPQSLRPASFLLPATPGALRGRIAVRLEIARQDQLVGDTGAYQRNMREAGRLERLLASLEAGLPVVVGEVSSGG